MATLMVRNLDEEVQRSLKRRAADNGRSMEAEVRAILTAALTDGGLAQTWVQATSHLRGDEIDLSERSEPRQVDLG